MSSLLSSLIFANEGQAVKNEVSEARGSDEKPKKKSNRNRNKTTRKKQQKKPETQEKAPVLLFGPALAAVHSRQPPPPKADRKCRPSSKLETERRFIRQRWKKRKIDLRDEVDIGGSVAIAAKKWKKRQRLQSRPEPDEAPQSSQAAQSHSKPHAKETQQQQETEQRSIILRQDSSDEEKERILGGLLRKPENGQGDVANDQTTPTEEQPYADRFDYWQLGLCAPPLRNLPFVFQQREGGTQKLVASIRSSDQQHEPSSPSHQDTSLKVHSLVNWSTTYRRKRRYQHWPFGFSRARGGGFLHRRQLIRLAARYITAGGGGRNVELADHLLRALKDKGFDHVHRSRLLETFCSEQAHDMQLYQQYSWTNRGSFLLTNHNDHGLVEGKLNREHIHRHFETRRRRIIRNFSVAPRNWLPVSAEAVVKECRKKHTSTAASFSTPDRHDAGYIETPPSDSRKIADIKIELGKTSASGSACSASETPLDAEDGAKDAEDQSAAKTDAKGDVEINSEYGTENDSTVDRDPSIEREYTFVSGTIPPVPSFPLDEAGIIFGRRDRFYNTQLKTEVNETLYTLNFSSLLSRLATAKALGGDAREPQQQLLSFIKNVPKQNMNQLYKRIQVYDPSLDLPLPGFYRAFMMCCCYMANGCSSYTDPDAEEGEHGLEETQMDVHLDEYAMETVARLIYNYSEPLVGHPGLEPYPRILEVFALASVAKVLPPSAADIISRPLDDWKFRTPFDLMRSLLEHMEQYGMLADSDDHSSQHATVGELEYSLQQAAGILDICAKRDPQDYHFVAWKLSFLTAGMLLGSGHRIGSGARRVTAGIGDTSGFRPPRDIRRQLKAFQGSRNRVAHAFRDLLSIGKRSGTVNLLISSFLEWRQAVGLLAGDACGDIEIRSLHAYHATKWALYEKSSRAYEYVRRLAQCNPIAARASYSHLAAMVEDNPGGKANWARLATGLGPLGTGNSGHTCGCGECNTLRSGLYLDHSHLDLCRKSPDWWGADRISWWDASLLLHTPTALASLKSADLSDIILAVEEALHQTSDTLRGESVRLMGTFEVLSPTLTWLPGAPTEENADDTHSSRRQSETERSADWDECLPMTYVELLEQKDIKTESTHSIFLNNDVAPPERVTCLQTLEVICYKIIITCHLYSPCHPHIEEGIRILLGDACGRSPSGTVGTLDTKSPGFVCLEWLYSMGIDPAKILQTLRKRIRAEEQDQECFPDKEKAALAKGLQTVGRGQWRVIMDRFEDLRHCDYGHIQYLYRHMVRNGEIDKEGNKLKGDFDVDSAR